MLSTFAPTPGGLLGRSTPSEVDVEAAVTPDGPWAVYIDLRIGQRRDIDATTPADRSPSGRGVCLRVRNGAGHDPRRRARRSRRSWPGSMECRRGVGTAVRVLPLPAHRLPRTRADANTPAAGASPGSRSGCSRVTRPPWSAFLLGRWWGAPRGIRGWEAIGPRDRVGFRPARGLRPREPEPRGPQPAQSSAGPRRCRRNGSSLSWRRWGQPLHPQGRRVGWQHRQRQHRRLPGDLHRHVPDRQPGRPDRGQRQRRIPRSPNENLCSFDVGTCAAP